MKEMETWTLSNNEGPESFLFSHMIVTLMPNISQYLQNHKWVSQYMTLYFMHHDFNVPAATLATKPADHQQEWSIEERHACHALFHIVHVTETVTPFTAAYLNMTPNNVNNFAICQLGCKVGMSGNKHNQTLTYFPFNFRLSLNHCILFIYF